MPELDHYDVVIIGSGAGGGTLAWKLAPSGKRILLLERGRLSAPGAGQLGHQRGVRAGQVPLQRGVATTRTATSSPPNRTTTSEATPSSTAPPCSVCARGLRGDPAPRWPLAGLAALLPGVSSRTTPRPSASTTCTARPARIPPMGRVAASSPTRRSSTSRASRSSTMTWSGWACTPRIFPWAFCSTRTSTASPSTPAPASAVTGWTGSLAW